MANGNGHSKGGAGRETRRYRSVPVGAAIRGRKHAVTDAVRRANRANAKKPRWRKTTEEKEILRAMALDTLAFLKGPALDRMKAIILTANATDATRAFDSVCNRFGLPVQTIQDVRASVTGAPLVQISHVQHARECAYWRREQCDCAAREQAD